MIDRHFNNTKQKVLSCFNEFRESPSVKRWGVEILSSGEPGGTWTRGSYLVAANIPGKKMRIEIWHDKTLDLNGYNFWIGFASENIECLFEVIKPASWETRNAILLTNEDYKTINGGNFCIRQKISNKILGKSVFEVIGNTIYLGQYFDIYSNSIVVKYIENMLVDNKPPNEC